MTDPFAGTAFEGYRHVTDYREIERALKARSPAPRRRPNADHIEAGSLLKIHGDRHTHRRRLEGALFSPEVLAGYSREVLGPTIARLVAGLATTCGADGLVRADFVEVGQRIVMEVTAMIIGLDGVREGDADEIYRLLVDFTEGIKVEYSTGDQSDVVRRAEEAKQRYWTEYVRPARDRRAAILAEKGPDALPNDLISRVLCDDSGAEDWDDGLLLRECILYLVGAGATTVALSAHAAVDLCRWLESHPEQAVDDDLLRNAVAEALRLHPPFVALVRDCPEAVNGGAFAAAAGETLFIDVRKGNLDPVLFGERPERFDPYRAVAGNVPRYGLSFGLGRHFCIGRPMAIGGRGTGTDGSLFLILRALMDAGMRLDPAEPPTLAMSMESRYARVPVIFERL
jgi:cytochrome P450